MKPAPSKILVVEDESIVASHIAVPLKNSGYEVTDTVTSGEMALFSGREDEPDLIWMDLVRDGKMSGTVTAEKNNSRRDVPVIFLTAYSEKNSGQSKSRICEGQTTEFRGRVEQPFSTCKHLPLVQKNIQ